MPAAIPPAAIQRYRSIENYLRPGSGANENEKVTARALLAKMEAKHPGIRAAVQAEIAAEEAAARMGSGFPWTYTTTGGATAGAPGATGAAGAAGAGTSSYPGTPPGRDHGASKGEHAGRPAPAPEAAPSAWRDILNRVVEVGKTAAQDMVNAVSMDAWARDRVRLQMVVSPKGRVTITVVLPLRDRRQVEELDDIRQALFAAAVGRMVENAVYAALTGEDPEGWDPQ